VLGLTGAFAFAFGKGFALWFSALLSLLRPHPQCRQ
jgi:hypothetical protein